MRIHQFCGVLAFLLIATSALAEDRREWTVDGVKREAIVFAPDDATKPAPIVFVFHGHGGSSERAARMFKIHKLWPEAIVVYPQGLNTPGRLTDPDGKAPGWQSARGKQDDRDIAFFDAMLKSFREEKRVDDKRVFVTGHSNGGFFTYVLWAARGDELTAVAPSGALDPEDVKDLKPKPVLHIAGRQDPLVKFEWQKRMIDAVLKINQCDPDAGKKQDERMTRYESKVNAPVITYIYEGAHAFPPETPLAIVDFFKPLTKSSQ